jgi:hypothetical protein
VNPLKVVAFQVRSKVETARRGRPYIRVIQRLAFEVRR